MERQRQREKERDVNREGEREIERDGERQRQREKERDANREGETERETDRASTEMVHSAPSTYPSCLSSTMRDVKASAFAGGKKNENENKPYSIFNTQTEHGKHTHTYICI